MASRNRRIKKLGYTPEKIEALLAKQKGRCAICRRKVDPNWGARQTHLDHNHLTGKVRGILCGTCNVGLGMFKESPKNLRRAAKYLEIHGV